jgi:hypothetical protein
LNQQERTQIAELWLTTASMYGKDIQRPAMKLMLDAVADLDPQAVMRELVDWVKSGQNRSHPLPGDLRNRICPPTDPQAYGREVAGRIVKAIGLYGWPQPAKARAFIGEEGWAVIEERGGWTHFCGQHGVDIDPGQFAAQARDRVADQVQRLGIKPRVVELVAPERPQLPEPKKEGLQNPANEMLQRLYEQKRKQLDDESNAPGPA